MRENGFFRVELLVAMFAIALVMFVAVPKAKSIVSNIKMNSAVDSVISYKESISSFYMSKLFLDDSFKLDGTYKISNGNLISDFNSYNISVYGNVPTEGYLVYQDNVLKDGCVVVDNFSVNIIEGEVISATRGSCSNYASVGDVAYEM